MQNIEQSLSGSILTLKIDLSKAGATSSSGKSVIIATTGGNKSITGYENQNVKIGLNVYKPH